MDARCLSQPKGYTIIELIIAATLLSVVMIPASSLYVASHQAVQRAQSLSIGSENAPGQTDAFLALQQMTRHVSMANLIIINLAGKQMILRVDFPRLGPQTLGLTPNGTVGTVFNTADDSWIKYRIFTGPDALRWRIDTTSAGSVLSTNPEVVPNLVVSNGSSFTVVNPNKVRIRLDALVGNPQTTPLSIETDIRAGAAIN